MATLFVSDLHLDAESPAAIDAFVALLDGRALGAIARTADALYILGDLFESWIGDDDDDAARDRACTALARYTATGVPVFVLHGNRDFLLGSGFESRTGCRLLPDPVVALLDGERVLLTHGDLLCTDDTAYQSLRSMTRAPAFQQRLRSLSLAQRQLLARSARAGSRAHTSAMSAGIMDVNPAAVVRVFDASGVRTMIHGHTHRPATHEGQCASGATRRIVLDAWYEQGSVLVWERGNMQRLTLEFASAA
jgi:UDP-2,3-diacylglucosamine hydrolase